jgi:hypothetical protein
MGRAIYSYRWPFNGRSPFGPAHRKIDMLKQFTLSDGSAVTVNLTTIAYMTPDGNGTLLMFVGGMTLVVSEPYDEVSGTKAEERVVGFGAG